MSGLSLFTSILLLSTGSVSVTCMIYIDREDSVRIATWLLHAIGVSLLLWNFGLALMVSAVSRQAALAGAHIAPVGYCMLFGFLLHYVLVITQARRALSRWWVYPLIYLPGVLTGVGLTVLPLLGVYSFQLIQTPFGWVNAIQNGWVWAYYAYYFVFLVAITVLLVRWRRRTQIREVQRQSRALLDSFLAMAVLGSLTDVLPGLFGVRMPGVASVFAVLPMFSITYSVKRLDFMRPLHLNPAEMILENADHVRYLYGIMGGGFLLGAVLTIFSDGRILSYSVPGGSMLIRMVMMCCGMSVLLVSRLRSDERFQELLVSFVFAFFIPFSTLLFAHSGNVTVWTFAFIIWVPGILFHRGILLRTVMLATFQAQLVVMAAARSGRADVGAADYAIRMGIIGAAAGLCLFVNYIYRSRLRENSRHYRRQNLVSEISHRLLLTEAANWDMSITQILAQCGRFMGCGQAYLVLWGQRQEVRVCRWRSHSLAAASGSLDASENAFFSALRELAETQPGIVPMRRPPIATASGLGADMARMHMRSLIEAPICLNGRVGGFLCLGAADSEPDWEEQRTFVAIVSDMVADTIVKIRSREKIRYSAYHDRLTGLPNRLLLGEKLGRAMDTARKTDGMVAVAFFDVDSFKSVNDSMGHEQGDRLLQQVARRLTQQPDGWETVARVGGDEFVLVRPCTDTAALETSMKRVMRAVRQPVFLKDQEFFITGSAGVALFPQDGSSAEELIANADMAMYQAKGSGRNQYEFCSQAIRSRMARRMQLTAQLYYAQEKGQLEVYYQPQVNLASHRIVGVEALLRWHLPGQGMISPAEFIPLAEQTGLIQPIGIWVLETACRQCREWIDRGLPEVRVAVNVSLQQLRNANFVDSVAMILHRTGMPPAQLELEVTESVANNGSADVPAYLAKLKRLGVTISIDDFGTEYSSLNRLKRLPVDRLKLDIQFIRGIEHDEKDRAITKVIISLAKSLHLHVIAEGVETAAQLRFLSERLCDEVQGFYYFRPMPAGELEQVLLHGMPESNISPA